MEQFLVNLIMFCWYGSALIFVTLMACEGVGAWRDGAKGRYR